MDKRKAKKEAYRITSVLIESYLEAEGVWVEWLEQDRDRIVEAFKELQGELEWRSLHRSGKVW